MTLRASRSMRSISAGGNSLSAGTCGSTRPRAADENAAARLEQQRRHDEEIVAADERVTFTLSSVRNLRSRVFAV